MKKKDTIQKGILMLISTSICLFIIEITLRIFFPQISDHDNMFRDDELLGWTFIPEKRGAIVYGGEVNHYVQINEQGFRDNAFQSDFEGKKIMVIGDSFVSNISVGANDVFTEVLEANLNNTSVMNFGVNGYGQVQELLQLQKWVDEIQPDLVVLMVYLRNDFADNIGNGQWNRQKPIAVFDENRNDISFSTLEPELVQEIDETGWKVYQKLHLYHFVSRRISNLRSKQRFEKEGLPFSPPEAYLCETTPDVKTEHVQLIMTKLIDKISDELAVRQIPLILAIAPTIVQVEDSFWDVFLEQLEKEETLYDRERPNKWLRQWSEGKGIATVDLFSKLYERSQDGVMVYNPKEQHWNKEGNKVVANVLKQHLEQYFDNDYRPIRSKE